MSPCKNWGKLIRFWNMLKWGGVHVIWVWKFSGIWVWCIEIGMRNLKRKYIYIFQKSATYFKLTFPRKVINFDNFLEKSSELSENIWAVISARTRAVISAHASARVPFADSKLNWEIRETKFENQFHFRCCSLAAAAVEALRHADTVCWFLQCKVSVLCVGLNFERAVRVDRFVLRGVSARHLYASDR